MLEKVKAFVEKWHMIEEGDKVITGVSGGADSICLLFVLLELQTRIPFEIIVVHVNHGLRGEQADADEAYVKQICREHHLPCVCYQEDIDAIAKARRQSTEEAGREIRRECFLRTMEVYQGTRIALAHHKNDNAETFLMNLARGTGLRGLGGIRPVAGKMIRPLLCLERREIEQYLKERGIAYCTDVTNGGDDYTRNRIRNHVIPYMEEKVNLRVVSHMSQAAERLREIQEYLDGQVEFYFKRCVKQAEMGYILSGEVFQTVPDVLKPFLLRKVLVSISGREKDIEAVHLEALRSLFNKQVGKRVDLPYKMEGQRIYDGICVLEKTEYPLKEQGFERKISFADGKVQKMNWDNWEIECRLLENEEAKSNHLQKSNTKRFDYDIIAREVCIRTRQPGDYITIHPNGGTQKLKTFFINEKIPSKQRDDILLVADGNHILWIVGYRANPVYQVKADTKQILEIRIDKGERYGRDN